MKTLSLASSVLIGVTLVTGARALDLDRQLPAYKPVPIDSAEIKSVGSDTLGDLMRNWADQFTKLNPNVKIEVESKGSATAPPALLDGVSQLGPMSRPMRSDEYEPFEKKYGYHPASFPVALDALAVYVNKDNPIECLTIEQLDQIFSKTHLYSGGKNVTTWGDAGLTGDWAAHPISLFGRNSASGTHDTFVDAVLRHGEFKDELKEQPGSAEVVKMVAGDKYAIGYSGIGYLTDGVRTVPLAAYRAISVTTPRRHRPTRGTIPFHAICIFISTKRRASLLIRRCWNSPNTSYPGRADSDARERLLSDHRTSPEQGPHRARHLKQFELKGIGSRSGARTSAVQRR